MKALCVKQPWAELIRCGLKTAEIRTWSAKYRGPILILASGQRSRSNSAREYVTVGDHVGGSICIVDLIDVVKFTTDMFNAACCAPTSERELAWQLCDATPVPFIPFKGRLGLFDVPTELVVELSKHPEISCKALKMLVQAL